MTPWQLLIQQAQTRPIRSHVAITIQEKLCNTCDTVKPITEFPIKGAGKFHSQCKACKYNQQKFRRQQKRQQRLNNAN